MKRPDTVVLGMGLATLTAVDGATPLTIGDRPGVIVAGVTIDAVVNDTGAAVDGVPGDEDEYEDPSYVFSYS